MSEQIRGLGVDIARIDRFDARMAERFLTEREREEYRSFTSEKRRKEYLAGHWAVKEAFVKALGTGFGKISPKDVEVMYDQNGVPFVIFKGESLAGKSLVSISHDGDYVVAVVVLTGDVETVSNSQR